jgi:hypothetical protein
VCCHSAAAAFKVFPTILEIEREAGSAALGTINVKVTGEDDHRFRILVEDVSQRPDGTLTYAPASGSRFSASSWVSVTPKTFSGAPDRVQPVQFHVAVPANAEPGDHLTSLTVQRLGGSGAAATATAIQAVSVRLTIRVEGRLHPAAEITALEVPGIAAGGPVSVATTVRNSGNVTLDFDRGNRAGVTIRDGDEVEATLPPWSGQLFPGQLREVVNRWEDPPLFGNFDARAAVRIGADEIKREVSFWVIPWRQIGALLLVIVAVVIFALGWRRRRWGY